MVQLRIYREPESGCQTASEHDVDLRMSKVRLGEILPLLTEAVLCERTWLRDFANDEVSIPADLHQVLLAYQYYRRPSA